MEQKRYSHRMLRRAGSALAGTAGAEVMAIVLGGTGPIDGAARLVVDKVPVPVVEQTVRRLKGFDKDATRISVVAAVAAVGALVNGRRTRPMAILALSAVGAATAMRRPPRRPVVALSSAVAGAACAVASDRSHPVVPVVAIGVAIAASLRRRRSAAAEESTGVPLVLDGAEDWSPSTPLVTPTRDFFVTDVNLGPPALRRPHRLGVTGLVQNPQELSIDDLRNLTPDPFISVLVCIHNQVGGHRLGNAQWRGVPLDQITELVHPAADARYVSTVAVDGFRATIPLDLLGEEGFGAHVILDMNGASLTPAHGGPLRFLVPGLYGQYNGAKWLSRLEFHRSHPDDYWTRRGWSHGPIRVAVGSRLDRPQVDGRTLSFTGVAWAPPHGVQAVDLLVNGRLVPGELADEVDPRSWRRFRAEAELPSGSHRVAVRAVSRRGVVQSEDPRPPFPFGATGLHRIEVHVP